MDEEGDQRTSADDAEPDNIEGADAGVAIPEKGKRPAAKRRKAKHKKPDDHPKRPLSAWQVSRVY